MDRQGQIYVLGRTCDRVYQFSPEGKYLSRFGSQGNKPGMLYFPKALAVDGRGRIYIEDFNGIEVFVSTGRYLELIYVQGAVFANGLAFDDQNNLCAVTNKSQVTKIAIVK